MTSLREFDQVELERLRRMRACFEAMQPDQSALGQVSTRFRRAPEAGLGHRLRHDAERCRHGRVQLERAAELDISRSHVAS